LLPLGSLGILFTGCVTPGLAEFTEGCVDLFGKLLRDCRLPIHWHEATLPPVEVGAHVRSTKVKTVLVTADFSR
jgi:hypothetical protein